ncbi:hypothetical protein MPDQ_003244 [Monascus purpureus]|uniref:Uncharacterized protein n=1 Tax=Monascus purpureus TaxID=5098 RepID=A0A507QNI1_MONPU|nr:hypothetical protein MPDQ_003244 [Monascus purpureus]
MGNTNIEIITHSQEAKVFLDRPIQDLIPEQYLREADRSPIIDHGAWVFRAAEDARRVNLARWSKTDIRYRGFFKTLEKTLPIHGSSNQDGPGKSENMSRTQGQAVYALLHDILDMMKCTRQVGDRHEYAYLRPRLVNCKGEYLTCYRQRHRTLEDEPWEAVLKEKCKLIHSQLLTNIRRLRPRTSNLPDQEAFLIDLHGSRLRIFRALLQGNTTSEKPYDQRELPRGSTLRRRCFSSPSTLSSAESSVRPRAVARYSNHGNNRLLTGIPPCVQEEDIDDTVDPKHNPFQRRDSEPLRILASHEYDLWEKHSFHAAVRALVALIIYLMSGRAQCGVLQRVFQCYPYHDEGDTRNDITINAKTPRVDMSNGHFGTEGERQACHCLQGIAEGRETAQPEGMQRSQQQRRLDVLSRSEEAEVGIGAFSRFRRLRWESARGHGHHNRDVSGSTAAVLLGT